MPAPSLNAVYGHVPRELAPDDVVRSQCSPRVPGSTPLSDLPLESYASILVHAPDNTVERRHVLASALRRLIPGGELIALAANNKGGSRIAAELEQFGCEPEVAHKRRHQIVTTRRKDGLNLCSVAIETAIADGLPRVHPETCLWTQPGLFSWDSIDHGSQLLLDHLPQLSGRGADLGCGIGVLARVVLSGGACAELTLIDIDARALEMARRNVTGEGVRQIWVDLRSAENLPSGLDFVVTNPPWHLSGEQDQALGRAFIQKAAAMLNPQGVLWLTANRHLAYEATLRKAFGSVDQIVQEGGYKIYRAREPLPRADVRQTHALGPRR